MGVYGGGGGSRCDGAARAQPCGRGRDSGRSSRCEPSRARHRGGRVHDTACTPRAALAPPPPPRPSSHSPFSSPTPHLAPSPSPSPSPSSSLCPLSLPHPLLLPLPSSPKGRAHHCPRRSRRPCPTRRSPVLPAPTLCSRRSHRQSCSRPRSRATAARAARTAGAARSRRPCRQSC